MTRTIDMGKVTGVLVDPDSFVSQCEVENTLASYHELLDCECFDITSVRVNGEWYDVFCDDEGLFKSHPKPTIADPKGKVKIVGKCFFAGHDEEGRTISLTRKEVKNILDRVRIVSEGKTGRYYEIVMCDTLAD